MPSRRRVLCALGTTVGAGVAGCTSLRSDGSARSVCAASIAGSDGPVFRITPNVRAHGGSDGAAVVELVVPVRRSVAGDQGVDLLVIDTGGGQTYRIPVDPRNDDPVGDVQRYDADDVVEYAQALGHLPQAGRYEVAALDDSGETIDSLRIDFRCYRPEQTPDG